MRRSPARPDGLAPVRADDHGTHVSWTDERGTHLLHTAVYEATTPALRSERLAPPSLGPGRLLRWIGLLAFLCLGGLALPWQQSVRGTGTVTALRPADRPQQVPAPIGGRIAEWHVAEGQFVERGAPLVRVEEVDDAYLDPLALQRLREQLAAKVGAVDAKRAKVDALGAQIAALAQGLVVARDQARNTVAQREAALRAAVADSAVAADQLARRERLHADGLVSLNDLQGARLREQQATAKAAEARNALANARLALDVLAADYADKLAKARADRAATLAEVSEGDGEAARLRGSVATLEARADRYVVEAPQAGYVVHAVRAGVGEQLKQGDPVVTIMPDEPGQAVALQVPATDVPLLAAGRKVRLQFDGWPAVQFSGWPSVAVGTFGGEIVVVDQVSGTDGRYRVLVRPDPADEPWPRELRQGSGVLGWAMLDEVTLAEELWRRLNGFPPAMRQPPADAATGKTVATGAAGSPAP